MPIDDIDKIMNTLGPSGPPLVEIPFTLPGATPGQMQTGTIQFIVRQIHEGGMGVELLNFVPQGNNQEETGEELKIIPSPS